MANDGHFTLKLPAEPDSAVVVSELKDFFARSGGDVDYQKGVQMAVPGAGTVYGVRVPDLRHISGQIVRRYQNDAAALANIAVASWDAHSREHELVALFILGDMRGLAPEERWRYGLRFLPRATNWESCDQLCAALIGQALAEDPRYMEQLEGWIEHEDFWVRRAALVATVYLRRAKYDEALAIALDQRALSMCGRLLDDREKYVRKAVDWAVRETIKRHYNLAFTWMIAMAESSTSSTARSTLKLAAKKLEAPDRLRLQEILSGE
jgi:3-methyladenine DNA glycosylase AlkD